MPREINAGFFSDLARAIFGVLEWQPFDVDDVVHPAVVLEGPRPEWLFLQGQSRFGAQRFIAAGGVGFGSVLALHNPPASGVLVIVEEMWAREGSTTAGRAGMQFFQDFNATGWTTVGESTLDSRRGVQSFPNAGRSAARVLTRNNQATPVSESIASWDCANTNNQPGHPWRHPLIIRPGDALFVYGVDPSTSGLPTVNAAFLVSVLWRERQLSKSDRA